MIDIFMHGLECVVLAYLLYRQWPRPTAPAAPLEHFEYSAGAGAMCVLTEKDGTQSSVRVFAHVTEPPPEIRRPHGLYLRGEHVDGRWIYHRTES